MNTGDCSRQEAVLCRSPKSGRYLSKALIQEKSKRFQTVIASGYCQRFFHFPPAAFEPVYNDRCILIADDPYLHKTIQ